MSHTTSRTASSEREEVDVVEIKKALATGNAKDTGPVGSASKCRVIFPATMTYMNLFPFFCQPRLCCKQYYRYYATVLLQFS